MRAATRVAVAVALLVCLACTAALSVDAALTVEQGYLISVAQNTTSKSTHVLLWNPATGAAPFVSGAIASWWPKTVKATIDPTSAFGDYFVHEDGFIFFMLFLSNNASPPSQQLQQWKIYDPVRGWIAPERAGKCLITASSDTTWPAMSSMSYNPNFGMFNGFTDFNLGTSGEDGDNLGIFSIFWNSPQCFQWPLKTYAQGLPAPLQRAGASAQHHASNTFAYLSATTGDGDDAAVNMVLVDVGGPVNSTLLPLPAHSSVSLRSLDATADSFAPELAAVNLAYETKGDGSAHFLLVQAATRDLSATSQPPPALLHFTAASGFSARVPEDLLPVFPSGPVAVASSIQQATGDEYPVLIGVAAAGGQQKGDFAFMTATPLAPEAWLQVGKPLDDVWSVQGQSLSFIPLSVAPKSAAEAKLSTRRVRLPRQVPHAARVTPMHFDDEESQVMHMAAPTIALE